MKAPVSAVGDACDDEMCESFFTTRECELIKRKVDKAEAQMAVFDFIEGYYHSHRRHTALDRQPPIDFERSRMREREAVCYSTALRPSSSLLPTQGRTEEPSF